MKKSIPIHSGYDTDPSNSHSLLADAYTETDWFKQDELQILRRNWRWVCHTEKTREPGSYITVDIAGLPIAVVRDRSGTLRAFYNVCKHRAHHLLEGEGNTALIVCPYHAWTYKLDGQLHGAPHTKNLQNFDMDSICLDQVQVEEFCGFVYVNLDPNASSLADQSGNLKNEIMHWAPDVDKLTFGHRLSYDIKSNWKNVVDNFLECYQVTTYGIYSSHMAEAGNSPNSAYDVSSATVKTHAVWWLWPTTCLMRYPGRSSMIVLNIIPMGPDRTLETYDFAA